MRGGGGTLHHQVPTVEDISVPCKQDDSQESKLLKSTSLDALPLGEVYVCFPPGSGKTLTLIICVPGGYWSVIKFIPYQVLTLRPRNRFCAPFGSQGQGLSSMSLIPFHVRYSTRQRVSNRCNIFLKRLSMLTGDTSTLHWR
jgi:hypothetical protein